MKYEKAKMVELVKTQEDESTSQSMHTASGYLSPI